MTDTPTGRPAAGPSLPAALGDGLVLRRAGPADVEALVAFNADVHREDPAGPPDQGIAIWTRDLLTRPHPTFDPRDFLIVEDTRRGQIVSSLNSIPQTWSYGGVEFPVGRVELVGTHSDYRRRGLVRRLFDAIHALGAARGELMQGITGIPYFYRQFGYELALALGGGRWGGAAQAPTLPEGAAEPFHLRPATPGDAPWLARVDAAARRRYLVTCVRDEALWRLDLAGRTEGSLAHEVIRIVETPTGQPVGYLVHTPDLRWGCAAAVQYELGPAAPAGGYPATWPEVTPSVIRYLVRTGDALAAAGGGRCDGFLLWLGSSHPAYAAASRLLLGTRRGYAWWVRVPDLPAFLRRIAPVLDARLAASPAAGYTGELRLSFYRGGVRLAFERGRLTGAEPWSDGHPSTADARFPDLRFLHLLLGHRSLAELEHAFADCTVGADPARALVEALFPPHPSDVWPIA